MPTIDHMEACLDQLVRDEGLPERTLAVYRTLTRRVLIDPDNAPELLVYGVQLRITAN